MLTRKASCYTNSRITEGNQMGYNSVSKESKMGHNAVTKESQSLHIRLYYQRKPSWDTFVLPRRANCYTHRCHQGGQSAHCCATKEANDDRSYKGCLTKKKQLLFCFVHNKAVIPSYR